MVAMSNTPETDAIVDDAEEMCRRAGLSGMEFWREMYGMLLSRMRRREIEGYYTAMVNAAPQASVGEAHGTRDGVSPEVDPPAVAAPMTLPADLVEEIREFLEDYSDVVDGEDGPRPNKAMALLSRIEQEGRT